MSGISIFSGDSETEFKRLQVNYWVHESTNSRFKFFKRRNKENYLDIGIEILKGNNNDVSIYFPCNFKLDAITCIGKLLKEKELADVLFNDSCEMSVKADDIHSFSVTKGQQEITVCTFDKSGFRSKQIGDGTLVTVNVPESEEANRYIRLRLDLKGLEGYFSSESQPLGSWLQSIRTKNREIDFRINSIRSIPQVILSSNNPKNYLADFDIIHFFYIASSDQSILFQNNPLTSARFLERGIWDKYFDTELKSDEKICAHHWKFEAKKEVSLFFRANFPHTNVRSIIGYLSFTAIFALLINLTSTYIYSITSELSRSEQVMGDRTKMNSTEKSLEHNSSNIQENKLLNAPDSQAEGE
jgi:hypothetical protein